MRQIVDLLAWVLLISVLLVVVVFTPRLAAYLSPATATEQDARSRSTDPDVESEAADSESVAASPFEVSLAPYTRTRPLSSPDLPGPTYPPHASPRRPPARAWASTPARIVAGKAGSLREVEREQVAMEFHRNHLPIFTRSS